MSTGRAYYAHSVEGRPTTDWQPLSRHLQGVAETAAALATEAAGAGLFRDAAYSAGILHDLGKYQDKFQQMLHDVAAGHRKARVEHSGLGAALAYQWQHINLAFAIAGHHAGLPKKSNLNERVQKFKDEARELLEQAQTDFSNFGAAGDIWQAPSLAPDLDPHSRDLWIRMLFSCLVDADRLDAAEVSSKARTLEDPAPRLDRLLKHVRVRAGQCPPGAVKEARGDVLDACLTAAGWTERLLSLTVPTGGGKTLSSMAFALKRASLFPEICRRVIVVIPYLSIIEQNAGVFAEVLGEDLILEHHSGNLVEEPEDDETPLTGHALDHKRAVENWNAPVVVTTSVRFFESLFSNRPKDLRRLHNLARSVVILDEVQTLPKKYLGTLLSMMHGLAADWETTFLFCTATQPAFEKGIAADEEDRRWAPGTLKEIIPEPQRLFDALQRVTVHWPGHQSRPARLSWEALADEIAAEPRALCILNRKDHAAEIHRLLRTRSEVDPERLRHLSTRMCPQHRLDVLCDIRKMLHEKTRPCRVVSTQLVEAGVDLDFPVVFRALAPLDSIAQAAGRCDREGLLTAEAGSPGGRVIVFEPDLPLGQQTPPGTYTEATAITRRMMNDPALSIHDTRHIRNFFHDYYRGDLDPENIQAFRHKHDFPEVSKKFHMIDEYPTRAVLVGYNDEANNLIDRFVNSRGLDMDLRRKLQRYQVALSEREFRSALEAGAICESVPGEDIWVCATDHYSQDTGLVFESSAFLSA